MSKQKPGREAYQVGIRLPLDYREPLRQIAERHGRSVNAEIVAAVTWHLSRHLSDEESTRRELQDLVQQFVDIVNFERDTRDRSDHLSSETDRLD